MNQTKQGIKPHGLFWFPLQLHSVDITCENIQIYTPWITARNTTSPRPPQKTKHKQTHSHTHTYTNKETLVSTRGFFGKKAVFREAATSFTTLRFAMLLTSCISCFQSLNWGSVRFRQLSACVRHKCFTGKSPVETHCFAKARWNSTLYSECKGKVWVYLRDFRSTMLVPGEWWQSGMGLISSNIQHQALP